MELDDEWQRTVCAQRWPVQEPTDLAGKLIGTREGAHAIHRYLLRRCYGINDQAPPWESLPQEQLLASLKEGRFDAAVDNPIEVLTAKLTR